MADAAKTSLNTATVRAQWNLRQCIEGCARHGIEGIAPWRDKLAEMGVSAAANMIRETGLSVTGLCRGGMFPIAEPRARQAVIDDNHRAVDEALEIGADCLVLVVGGLPDGSKDLAGARNQVRDGIAELLDYARPRFMPLAIEPLHPMYAADRACINTIGQANDLCDQLGDGLGIAVDVYHVWWDPDLEKEIARAGRERLLAFHVCDWRVPTRDLLLDRGMMGDGVIDIPLIRSWVEDNGYDGLYEVEIFSAEDWWKRDPNDVLKIMKERISSAV
jgi:sugar phosphate isomerase/epimerase